MNSLRPKFDQRGFDADHWQRQIHRHPIEYIRRKLRIIHTYAEGKTVNDLALQYHLHPQTVRTYITHYIQGGLDHLCQAEKRPQPTRLTGQQEADFKHTLLHTRPSDHALNGNIWTGQLMGQYLAQTYQVDYKSGIYDLLERLNLSHQKAHADYGNADPVQQQAFLDTFKLSLLQADKTHAVVVYDEFSVCEKPTTYYGWAEKNTRPVVVTDEKKGND
jgi:transposase